VSDYKKWRVAGTVFLMLVFCAAIIYWDMGKPDTAARIITFALGLVCGFVPGIVSTIGSRGANPFILLFKYVLCLLVFFVGGLVLVSSELWISGILNMSPELVDEGVMWKNFLPAFFLSTIMLEAIRYFRFARKVKREQDI
jgi:ABC-type dipeptide/oligopeptide/nickel transport system permease subunit